MHEATMRTKPMRATEPGFRHWPGLRVAMLAGALATGLAACETVGGLNPTGIAEVDDPQGREAAQTNIASLSEVIRANPNDPQAHNTRGVANARAGRFQEAIADFNRAIQLNPNYAAAYTNRALAFRQIGRNDAALADFNRALTADPNYHQAYLGRGNLYRAQGAAGEDGPRYASVDPDTAMNPHSLSAALHAAGAALAATDGRRFTQAEQDLQRLARTVYEARLEAGIAREQARKDLPLSTYTEAYWKIDLHNLLHFLALRMDSHAQLEIRRYAETIGREIVAPLFPLVWEAFLDYRVEALRLTRLDQEVIRRLAARPGATLPAAHADFLTAQDPSWRDLARCRERDECLAKLVSLGLVTSPETAS